MHLTKYNFAVMGVLALTLLAACNPQRRLARKQHKYMERAYLEIKNDVKEAEVSILNDTLKVLFPENLLFEKGKAGIALSTYPIMERFAKALLLYNNTHVLVNGHTDNTGSDEINNALSRQRADSAGALLIYYKVPQQRLQFWGMGSRHPIADNNTDTGRSRNRRVEFIILYKVEE